MSKRKTRLEELEDQRNQLINELDIYRLLNDEKDIDQLLVKLKTLDDMIRLAKEKRFSILNQCVRQPFDVKAFQQRVQQARTPAEYQQLKQELSERFNGLSPNEKTQLRQEFKPVWNELNSRVDKLIAETEEMNRQVTV